MYREGDGTPQHETWLIQPTLTFKPSASGGEYGWRGLWAKLVITKGKIALENNLK